MNAALFALARILRRLSGGRVRIYKYCFVAQPVAKPVDGNARSPASPVEAVTAGDPLVRQFPRPAQVIGRRFEEGAVCFAARRGDEFIGFLWLKLDGYDEDEVRCRYVPRPVDRTAWDFDVYVAPAHRMGRTFAQLWRAANEFLAARRVEWVLSRISAFNPESMRAHRRLGSRPIASALFLCAGPLQVSFLTRRPYLHLSTSAASFPTLELDSPAAGDA